jgi:shikimate kinase
MSRNPKSHIAAASHPTGGRSLVLVGLMGAGKSTVGRRLAARLGMNFTDADDAIEAAAGMTISEIFAKSGEAAFRDGERRVIARIIAGPPCVLATGGGAFVNDETRALILKDALAVWLDADVDTLVARVARRQTRPLLVGKDPRTVLTELAAVRNPLYAEAPLHVASASTPHEITVEAIMKALATCPV